MEQSSLLVALGIAHGSFDAITGKGYHPARPDNAVFAAGEGAVRSNLYAPYLRGYRQACAARGVGLGAIVTYRTAGVSPVVA